MLSVTWTQDKHVSNSSLLLQGCLFTHLLLESTERPAQTLCTYQGLVQGAGGGRLEEDCLHVRAGALQLGLYDGSLRLQRVHILHQLLQPGRGAAARTARTTRSRY